MLSFPIEPGLQESWLSGGVVSAALVRPVGDARIVCNWTEPEVRALRDSLQAVFEQWRNEKGVLPDGSNSGLLGNVYAGKPLDECPAYKCAGAIVRDYPDLLTKLRVEQYPPLLKLEAQVDSLCKPPPLPPDNIPRLPAAENKLGMQLILAALILSEASAGDVDSAVKAHSELIRIRDENERLLNEAMRPVQERINAFAVSGAKSQQGYKSRDDYQDKLDCQTIAAQMWAKKTDITIAALMLTPAIAPYVRKYPDIKTVRGWLSEIDPRPPEKKRGRPKAKN